MATKQTVPTTRKSKVRDGSTPLVMVTAYDAPTARIVDAAGVDLLLVGDTLAMVVLGYEDTRTVTTEQMAHHIGAVARTNPNGLIVGDMPWMSYHLSTVDAVKNAATLVRAGAEVVKLEGGQKRLPVIEAILDAEIPVMGHLGLTPQSSLAMGGFRLQAKTAEAAKDLIQEAKKLEAAGCSSIVLEGVPSIVGRQVTEAVSIPIIGIGAGPDTDGQVLVFHDLVGLETRLSPKFVRRYGTSFEDQVKSVQAFAADVRSSDYPNEQESYAGPGALTEQLGQP